MHGRVVGDPSADRIPCAAIENEAVTEGKNLSLTCESNVNVMCLVARMTCAHEMLVPIFNPAYRPANTARQKWDEQIFRIDVTFQAKASANVQREAAHARFRHPQHACRFAANPMDDLSQTPDGNRVGARLVQGNNPAAFHGGGGIAMRVEPPLHSMRRRGQETPPGHSEGGGDKGGV